MGQEKAFGWNCELILVNVIYTPFMDSNQILIDTPLDRPPSQSDKEPIDPDPCGTHRRHPVDSALGCRGIGLCKGPEIGLWKGVESDPFWLGQWFLIPSHGF